MELEANFEIAKIPAAPKDDSNGQAKPRAFHRKVAALQRLALQLLEMPAPVEIKVATLQPVLKLKDGGLDFYEEVSRFEIDLINSALQMTGGHQLRASRPLKLNPTTLNSKIKHYRINLDQFARHQPLAQFHS